MNAVVKDCIELDVARIRALQGCYPNEHRKLTQWGLWSGDRRGIYPTLKPPSVWDNFKRSEVDGYGEEEEEVLHAVVMLPVKAERAERIPYDEKTAVALDERIHGYGGLPKFIYPVLKAAYVSREIPENQFQRAAGYNTIDQFCEYLETALLFVRRFG